MTTISRGGFLRVLSLGGAEVSTMTGVRYDPGRGDFAVEPDSLLLDVYDELYKPSGAAATSTPDRSSCPDGSPTRGQKL